ncbi:MAG: iron chelate uptake ABC transporter family permease subunit, partial [Cyanobacteria bacterium REEB65]|nr:iron chelate uptake ABC transporter family permease subunit [Cyanobacteria bacterium REEB65]
MNPLATAPVGSVKSRAPGLRDPSRRTWGWSLHLVWLAAGLVLALACGLALGTVPIPLTALRHLITGQTVDPTVRTVVLQLRLPRVLLAMCTGAGLAASGAAWQGILRNPLADPYLIGVSAGGALGAGMAIAFGWHWPNGAS